MFYLGILKIFVWRVCSLVEKNLNKDNLMIIDNLNVMCCEIKLIFEILVLCVDVRFMIVEIYI